jgi:hypothetical protein
MTIYRLLPSAPPDDPNWDRAVNHAEGVVRAHSTGEARAIAALEEASIRAGGIPSTTTQVVASAFGMRGSNTVKEDNSGTFGNAGPARVLRGDFRPLGPNGLKID